MNHTPKLNDQMVLNDTCAVLEDSLPLKADGYICTGHDLWQVLLGVSAEQTTVEDWCANHEEAPTGATVRGYLKDQLTVDALPGVERRLNEALGALIPARVFRAARETAVDYHDQAYYGKTPQAEGRWIRAAAQDGTTRFYRIATACVLWQGLRVTLAVHFVQPDDDTVDVLAALLKRLNALHYRVKRLYLDRGFDGVRVARYLTEQHLPAVIACTIRGKQGGTRALCVGRASYATTYTFNPNKPEAFLAHLAVCRTRTTARRTGRAKRRPAWMLFILVGCALPLRQVRQAYRRRFGIESSYRCARRTRGKTTSPNPALRFLLLALSFVILNLWVQVRWRYAQRPARGHRRVLYAHLRLSRVRSMLIHALDQRYHRVTTLEALAVPIE
jgi:hypothetical protein